jgi:hypothetical protein
MKTGLMTALAEDLEALAFGKLDLPEPFEFDLNLWLAPRRFTHKGYCGCALGLATLRPTFQKHGLRMGVSAVVLDKPDGDFSFGMMAARDLFDLPIWQVRFLFDREHYRPNQRSNPLLVAERIRQVIQ